MDNPLSPRLRHAPSHAVVGTPWQRSAKKVCSSTGTMLHRPHEIIWADTRQTHRIRHYTTMHAAAYSTSTLLLRDRWARVGTTDDARSHPLHVPFRTRGEKPHMLERRDYQSREDKG